jgi:hypothetical protein
MSEDNTMVAKREILEGADKRVGIKLENAVDVGMGHRLHGIRGKEDGDGSEGKRM